MISGIRYHHISRSSVTVDCDTEIDLLEAISDQDRFLDRAWQMPLREAGQTIAAVYAS